MNIINKLIKPKPSIVLDTYWNFAYKRQEIFFNKIINPAGPWTDDEVLIKHKFTNVYRASDRVSQFLIQKVIYQGSQEFKEVFFRTILFKIFNKIETWELLVDSFSELTTCNFDVNEYSRILIDAKNAGETLYSGAYIMASGKSNFGYDYKLQNHLALIKFMLDDKADEKIIESKSLEEVFNLLKSYPTIGNFLAYQYTIDLNYSDNLVFSEMDFVMPGPGAKDGIRKCFTDYGNFSESDIISYIADVQELEFERLGIDFKTLWGRQLQLIDCQNLFCEVDKYARVVHADIKGLSGRKRIKQIYKCVKPNIDFWFPPKWNINSEVESYGKRKECIHQPSR